MPMHSRHHPSTAVQPPLSLHRPCHRIMLAVEEGPGSGRAAGAGVVGGTLPHRRRLVRSLHQRVIPMRRHHLVRRRPTHLLPH